MEIDIGRVLLTAANGDCRDDGSSSSGSSSHLWNIFPIGGYYFGSRDAVLCKKETSTDRLHRLKSNYDANGLRTCVEAVILVELSKHPHLLLSQVRNCMYKLPGGRLRPGESDIDGLKRKLCSKLSIDEYINGRHWEVGECLGTWWRTDFEALPCRDLPPYVKKPKECTKLFLVKLPVSRKFIVPRNQKLLAIPLHQIHKNLKEKFKNSVDHKMKGRNAYCSKVPFRVLSRRLYMRYRSTILISSPLLLEIFQQPRRSPYLWTSDIRCSRASFQVFPEHCGILKKDKSHNC